MEEQKRPHIPAWKVWLLVITTAMAISAVQDYRTHQQMRKEIYNTQYLLNQAVKDDIEYYQNLNHALDLISQELQEQQ